MIHIAIVEDNKQYASVLTDYLKRFEQRSGQRFKIAHFTDGVEIVRVQHGFFDIILMDIEMKVMDGLAAAKAIRETDRDVIIMFITQAPQYAIGGFEVEALDYILKPINYYAFTQRLERAIERMQRREQKFLMLDTGSTVRKIMLASIRYVEVTNHQATYHLLDETLTLRASLKSCEQQLNDGRFFKINQSTIINFDYMESATTQTITIDNQLFTISRARRKIFLDTYNNYVNEVSK
ncbi:response regulator transcription factor [Tuanshanicoccus lijuaniae]|uniref:LytR/AlgR family response regulator transcription factor n=1 Tax=Aerococcaceae bacterium zg-1292 TaxID=2774330 RepID=UPI001938CAFF|nr:response regulator transcription factor [Aerococcaceae bacterium zg-1292]MBF6626008.1 response regulator transcription factor [Aerococcaceae bacterium zg-BR9]MBF6978902.1 response regulator transcription factor [Aerococcaceae bacterium zg-BR22]MBS4455336.1 response regulator transcription factor [Aerococcaceae bacterium zg-A91]MBS4457296.1 response regulator transcription factor [Aerococcaceae bacterium zg-BR33]